MNDSIDDSLDDFTVNGENLKEDVTVRGGKIRCF